MPDVARMSYQLNQAWDTAVIFDDFSQFAPVVQNVEVPVAALGSGASLSTEVVAGFPRSVRLTSIDIIPETTATISNTNTSTWTLKNGTTQILSAVFNASSGTGSWPTPLTCTSLGTIVDPVVQAGGCVTLAIAGASSSVTPQTVLQIGYIDLGSLPGGWAAYLPNSGNVAPQSAQSGIVTLTPSDPNGTPATSDEAYLYQPYPSLIPQSGYPIFVEGLIQYTEANTNEAGIFFGLASGVSAGGLITAGAAGVRSTGTVVGFYKTAGTTNWSVIAQNGSSNSFSELTTIPCGTSAYQRLTIEVLDVISGTATVVFRVDGQLVRVQAFPNVPYQVQLPLTSDLICSLVAGVKNGSSSMETLNIDYIGALQSRVVGADG